MTDVFLVTKDNYPTLFQAFELISHDCGRRAGHTNYAVPLAYQGDVLRYDWQLAKLHADNADDFILFCIGAEENKERLVQAHDLGECDGLLQRFFEEFR